MRLWFGKGAWASKAARKRIRSLLPEDVNSIAIIRHAALGDMILTRPFIIECRRAFPNAKITLSLVSNYMRGIPDDIIDRVHVVHGREERNVSLSDKIKKIRELGRHDIIFDVAATSRSLWVTKLNHASLKIGYPFRWSHRHLFYDITVLRSALRYETDSMLDMLHIFGIKTKYPLDFKLPGEALTRDRPYIVYFTSASMASKCWPEEHFSGLLQKSCEVYKEFDHIVLKGVTESESIKNIISGVKNRNVVAYEANSVESTISLLKGAKAVISNDTGIRHLAVAANIPTVGIFLNTDEYCSEPYRYWLRYPIHEVAFRVDGKPPDVNEVFQLLKKIIRNKYHSSQE